MKNADCIIDPAPAVQPEFFDAKTLRPVMTVLPMLLALFLREC
jgi:hypothetical protein